MSKIKTSNIFFRIFISIIGIGFILWGIGTITLGVIGEKSIGVITNVRREGGEISSGKSGRYTYIISYTFPLPGGKKVDGYSRKISDSIFVKTPNTITKVRYLKAFPRINVLEEETNPSIGQFVFIFIGGFLIYVMKNK